MKEFIIRVIDPEKIKWYEEEPEIPELVRCKDCRHSLPSSENFVICTAPCNQMAHTTYKPIDWFCADGKRK